MGIRFGELAKLTGITYFRLSPYEQKPFAGSIDGFGRLLKRGLHNLVTIGPFFMGSYILMVVGDEENKKFYRKDPKKYENDV